MTSYVAPVPGIAPIDVSFFDQFDQDQDFPYFQENPFPRAPILRAIPASTALLPLVAPPVDIHT